MAIHKDLTGADAIHPAAYVQSGDPGAVGANKTWYDTTTSPYVHKVRNAANTAWVAVGASGTSGKETLAQYLATGRRAQ